MQHDIKHDKSHENVKLTMDNLHTQKTEEKLIQTQDQPKITNFQVESQNQYTMYYIDESNHEDNSMHTIEKHSTHHHYNPLKNDPSVFEYLYPPEHGDKTRFYKSTFYISINIQTTYSPFQQYQDYTSNFIKSRIIYISK